MSIQCFIQQNTIESRQKKDSDETRCLLQQDYQKSRTERNCIKRLYPMQLDNSKQEDLTEESVLVRKFQQIIVDKSPNAIDRKLRSSG